MRTLRVVCAARLRGRLYDLGPYPGAIADAAASGRIHGQVVETTPASPPLAWFDAYEDFAPDAPERSEFRRVRLPVETEAGPLACWVYVLARVPATARLLADGTWSGPPR